MTCSHKRATAMPVFAKKSIALAISMALGCASAFVVNKAKADPVYYSADGSNASIGMAYLNQQYLGNGVLSNPSSLETGVFEFKYAAVLFRPTESGTYKFGQTSAGPTGNVDTVMILYDGGYDPTAPGTNAVVGNDDTSQADHRTALNNPTLVTSCNSSSWCPQVTYNVVAGQVYTLWVSVYNGESYNSIFDIPFNFYSSGAGDFASTQNLVPIDTNESFYVSSELDFTVSRVFKGGTLQVDQTNFLNALPFVVHNTPDNTIDSNGNNATFAGVISDAVAGEAGSMTIINSGSGGSVTFSGNNTYSGGTTVATNATLNISSDKNLGASSGGLTLDGGTLRNTAAVSSNRAVTIDTGGGMFVTDAGLTLNGTLSGDGLLLKYGSGKLTLNNDGSVGNVSLHAGELEIIADKTLTSAGGFIMASGTTLGVGVSNVTDSPSVLTDTFTATGGIINITSYRDQYPPSGGTVTAIVRANSAITRDYTLQVGGVAVPTAPSIDTFLAVSEDISNDNEVRVNTELVWNKTDSASAHGTFNVGSGQTFTLMAPLADNTTPGAGFAGWDGRTLTKTGAGTLVLGEANTYTGETQIQAGTLALDTTANAIAGSSAVTVDSGATLALLNGVAQTANNLSGTGNVNLGTSTLTANNTANTDFGGTLGGTGILLKAGSGTLVLSGNNGTFTGNTTVAGGELSVSADNNLGATSSRLTLDGGSLRNTAAMSSGRAVTIGTSGGTLITDAGLTLSGAVSGSGDLTKTGAGTLVLSSNNSSFTGNTTVAEGVLSVAADNNLGAASSKLTLDGGSLRNTVAMSSSRAVTIGTSGGTFITNAGLTLSGAVSGNGTLTKDGSGTLRLENNASVGGVNVNSGSLEIFGDNTLTSAGSFTMASGTSLDVNVSVNPAVITDTFSATGANINITDYDVSSIDNHPNPATATIVRANSAITRDYSLQVAGVAVPTPGVTSIDTFLEVHEDTSLANEVRVNTALVWENTAANSAHGTFNVAGGNTFTINAPLADNTTSGAGFAGWDGRTLTKTGAGTLVLGEANTYTGETQIQAGTLALDTTANAIASSSAVTVDSGATLALLNGVAQTANNLSGTGNVNLGTSTLTASNTADTDFGGTLGGTGTLVKTGSGTLALSGDNGAFTGNTIAAGGELLVSNNLGGFVAAASGGVLNVAAGGVTGETLVAAGGVLGGEGTVGHLTVQNGGMVSPARLDASAPLTNLHVSGDAVFDTGSYYRVRIDETMASDHLAVAGTATLNGGTVQASLAPWAVQDSAAYVDGSLYTILTADGGVKGRFSDLMRDFAFFDLLLDYDENNVFLKIKRVPFTSYAETENQWQAATGAESLGYGNELYDAILKLPYDGNVVRNALNQISGEAHASIQSALIEDNHFVRDAANDRMRAARGGKGSSGNTETIDANGNVVWGRVFGSWGKQEGNRNAAELKRNIGGFVFGTDVAVADWRVGGLAGYSRSDYDVDSRDSHGNSDNYHVGGYATTSWDALAFRSGLFYTWHDVDTKRSVNFPGYSDRLKGNYDAQSWQVFSELAYRHSIDVSYIEPYANLTYVNLRTDGFTEHGGAAAVHSSSQTMETTFSTLGLRLARDFTANATNMTLRGLVGWRHAFGDIKPESSLNYIGGTGYNVTGTPIAKDAAVLEAGIDVKVSRAATLGISYQGMVGDKAHEHGGFVHFNWAF